MFHLNWLIDHKKYIIKGQLILYLQASISLGYILQKSVQLMLVCPIGTHEEIHIHLSFVFELDRPICHAFIVVVVAQYSAEEAVQLLKPWLEFILLFKYSFPINVYITKILL